MGEQWTDREFRRFATANDVAEEAESLPEAIEAVASAALVAVVVAVRDGAMRPEPGCALAERLVALWVESGEVAKAMAAASARARRGDR